MIWRTCHNQTKGDRPLSIITASYDNDMYGTENRFKKAYSHDGAPGTAGKKTLLTNIIHVGNIIQHYAALTEQVEPQI